MIRFPKIHIAESVANRLLNFADGLDVLSAPSPSLPEPTPAGAALDKKLSSPPGGAAPAEAVVEGVATGESALDSLIKG